MMKWTAALVLSGALFFLLNTVYPADADGDYTVDMTVGAVDISHDGGRSWVKAETDSPVAEKDIVRTGPSSVCEIGMPGEGGTFRMEEKSEMEMGKLGKVIQVKVKSGRSFFDIFKPLGTDEMMEVETETAVVSVRGTQFFVESGTDDGAVSVADGKVLVRRNVRFETEKDLDKDFRDAVETPATSGQEIRYSRRDNSEFLARLKAFHGNRAEMRKFLRNERMENAKRLRPFRDRRMIAAILKAHRADMVKIQERRKNMNKNKARIIKKRVIRQQLRK